MKKVLCICLLLFVMTGITACDTKRKEPEHPIVFETKSTEEYVSIIWGDKEYVPYCAVTRSQVGECLGYFFEDNDTAKDKTYVCELKGYNADEWIVDVLNLNVSCNEGMIFREKNTTTIPEGIHSEYEWNP